MNKKINTGFTIVELLVVIVVIGILAAITVVSYTGITQKAITASLQSDLSNASKKLKMYYVETGYYPTDVTLNSGQYCPAPADIKYCFKPTPGNTLNYPTQTANSQVFTMTATNSNGVSYKVTNDTGPTLVSPVVASGGNTLTYTDSSGLNPRSSPSYAGGYTIQTFTSSGTLIVTNSGIADVLIIGGGGGGGTNGNAYNGGGGGGGQFISDTQNLSGTMTVTVGAGGAANSNGSSTIFGAYTAIGGGKGANPMVAAPGGTGASGGGGTYGAAGGVGTAGNNGGSSPSWQAAGGGGGAGAVGFAGVLTSGGTGGIGLISSISGVSTYYCGGGGGGGDTAFGLGGLGGGGRAAGSGAHATAGIANTGGGGGGSNNTGYQGSSGGSGIVIVRYQN